MVFDKFFSWAKKKQEDPPIPFGRYSDNNKSVQKVERWTDADNFFKENDYHKSIEAFFDYLCDEEQDNVIIDRKDGIKISLSRDNILEIRGVRRLKFTSIQ